MLEDRYGERLACLCVFGSRARNDADGESDLDLLVPLKGEFDYFQELREIVEILDEIQQDGPFLISAKPARFKDFQEGTIQLYRNAKEEGILF